MQRLNDTLLKELDAMVSFEGKKVLEIGCGNGSKSQSLARLCNTLYAIDPDKAAITTARENHMDQNVTYTVGSAQDLHFEDNSFDVVIFSLSLHHVPTVQMPTALHEASRVCKAGGKVVVAEPGFDGTFFEAEIAFDACDGDERIQKAAAYYELLRNNNLQEVTEFYTNVTFEFSDVDDFTQSMGPTRIDNLEQFLKLNDYKLWAQRRVNLFTPS